MMVLPGSEREGWARPCLLSAELLKQQTLAYDLKTHNFVAAVQAILGTDDLSNLHEAPVLPPSQTPPSLRRAQIQAQIGEPVRTAERKDARNHAVRFEKTEEYRRFLEVYHDFVATWVVPALDCGPLLYQRKP